MNRRTFLATATSAVAGAIAARPYAPKTYAAQLAVPNALPGEGSFCRPHGWGVCAPPQPLEDIGPWVGEQALALLQPVRWHTWGLWPEFDIPGRMPVIWSNTLFNRTEVRQRLMQHPGEVWFLPNEPELPLQASMTPGEAVDLTLEFIDIARSVGNPFQWCSPAVTLDTEFDGLAWLTEYMRIMRTSKGIMRPAYWCVHPYASPNVEQLRSSWQKWREWYAIWGSGAPVVLNEACAENASLADQIAVMDEFRAMLDRGEVVGVFWFSAYLSGMAWPWCDLCDVDVETQTVQLNDLGRHWKELQ